VWENPRLTIFSFSADLNIHLLEKAIIFDPLGGLKMAASQDFIMTLDSGDEGEVEEPLLPTKKIAKGSELDDSLNPDFTFDLSGDPYADALGVEGGDIVKTGSRPVRAFQPSEVIMALSVLFRNLFQSMI
jgi:hypothetical protein